MANWFDNTFGPQSTLGGAIGGALGFNQPVGQTSNPLTTGIDRTRQTAANLQASLPRTYGGTPVLDFFRINPAYASEGQTLGETKTGPQETFGDVMRDTGLGQGPQNYVSTGGGGGGSTIPTFTTNTGQQLNEQDWLNSSQYKWEQAQREQSAAENQRLNTQFDYSKAQLEGQLGGLGRQRDESLAQVDLGLGDINRQVGTSKTNLQTNTQNQIKQAGSTARNVQGQNRNVLRALGILNSSAAGQILAKPLNQFDEQRAQLGQLMVQKTTELDEFVNQKVSEASQVKNSIVGNYNDLVNKIQTDLRFNDRQRNDALQAANAALSQRMAEISQAVMNYQQQAQVQKQQFATQMAAALNYQNPQYNQQAFQALGMVNPTQGTQTAQIYQDPNKKKLGDY